MSVLRMLEDPEGWWVTQSGGIKQLMSNAFTSACTLCVRFWLFCLEIYKTQCKPELNVAPPPHTSYLNANPNKKKMRMRVLSYRREEMIQYLAAEKWRKIEQRVRMFRYI